MRLCKDCQHTLPLGQFASKMAICRGCKSKRDKGRARSSNSPRRETTESARIRKRKWMASNYDPHKMRARRVVRSAIESGKIIVPDVCEICRTKPREASDGRRGIQAHHHAGYDKPLDIEWLCPKCHRAQDDAAREARNG